MKVIVVSWRALFGSDENKRNLSSQEVSRFDFCVIMKEGSW